QASTSATRVQPSAEAFTTTRIFAVVIDAKLIFFQTLLFPLTLPPGTVTQSEVSAFQYCASKPVSPYKLKFIVSVGSDGLCQLSWMLNTSISEIVLLPLKSTSSHCGNVAVELCQPPPFGQFAPLRSPLIA